MSPSDQSNPDSSDAVDDRNLPESPGQETSAESPMRKWLTFRLGCMWLAITIFAFPPVGISPLGWLSTVPLAMLVWRGSLTGRRPYLWLWIAGWLYWLGTFYFIPIPHPLLWFGWLAVSAYLAIYLPLTVASARVMVHGYRIPVPLAVAISVTGWEYIRCFLFTGMGMVCLSHTQYQHPIVIQVADLCGAYTLTFLLAMFGAAIGTFFLTQNRQRWSYLATAIVVAAFVFGYGYWQLSVPDSVNDGGPKIHAALIQGSIDTEFPDSEEEHEAIEEKRFIEYRKLTFEAREKWGDELDVIIWPESSFGASDFLGDYEFDDSWTEEEVREIRSSMLVAWSTSSGYPEYFADAIPMIIGTTTYGKERVYNSAILVGEDGVADPRYFKIHLVIFGEFVPGRNLFPWLQQLTPIGRGLNIGEGPKIMEVKGTYIMPGICFESTVPHLVRKQFLKMKDRGKKPDVLLNITNDGWFYGTSCLDFHLACNVFRAVEMRTKMLVCANTGFSAEISNTGTILQCGPRRKTGIIKAKVEQIDRSSPYLTTGDTGPGVCAVLALLGLLSPFLVPWRAATEVPAG